MSPHKPDVTLASVILLCRSHSVYQGWTDEIKTSANFLCRMILSV